MKTRILLLTMAALLLSSKTQGQIINIPDDYPTIQQGIYAASDGDTVLVDEGTYYENIRFFGKAITVASNFILDGDTSHISNTIIDGSQPEDPDKGAVVMFMNGEDTTSVLTGFTITGGTGLEIASQRMGGGIVCFQSGAKIINNKIINNEVTHTEKAFGGGICCYYDAGETLIIVENNTVSGNICNAVNVSAFGGGIYACSGAAISNNIITNNACNCELADADGGGIETENLYGIADSVYITNNTISYNSVTAAVFAGGGGVASILHSIFINNNSIEYNTLTGAETQGSGLWLVQSAETVLDSNLVSQNTVNKLNAYWGVGAMIWQPMGSCSITGNEFSNNTGELTPVGAGGGLCINGAFNNLIYVESNRFIENEAYHGGGFFEKNTYNLILIGNLFEGNESYRGGAIGTFHPTVQSGIQNLNDEDYRPQIINNTFVLNSASNDAGAIRLSCELNAPEIYNCIFHGNTSPFGNDIYNWKDDTAVVSFSNLDTDGIVGNWLGIENINHDPMFVNSGDYPYQINDYSPCIDAGNPDTAGLNLPEFDLAGEIRIFNNRVDMGAYEWTTFVGVDESEAQSPKSKVWNYPNPFTTSTTIEYELEQLATVQITIYNHLGKQLEIIEQSQSAGKQQVVWNAEGLPSGVYFCVLKTKEGTKTTKMIKMK